METELYPTSKGATLRDQNGLGNVDEAFEIIIPFFSNLINLYAVITGFLEPVG